MKVSTGLCSILSLIMLMTFSCGNSSGESHTAKYDEDFDVENAETSQNQAQHITVTDRTIFNDIEILPSTAFIVISKKYTDLSVYAPIGNDTVLLVRYPVCLSRALGQKEKSGDMKTPECSMEEPFTISQILNASDWHHDFGDGRGSIKSYGDWFLRLRTPPHTGIGIHGSTNNESSVPGRDSEGCIRMRDEDIIHLKENYAFKGMKVVVKHEDQDLLPFEKNIKLSYTQQKVETPKEKQIAGQNSEVVKAEEKTETVSSIPVEKDNSVVTYKVKKGDTLSKIAKKNNTTVSKICELNNMTETDADKLRIDQVIRVK